jgi:intein/homing endonuclease
MSVKELQEFTRISRYARYNNDKGRRETWKEQVKRVTDMHKDIYGDKLDGIQEDFDLAVNALNKKLVLGSQRALQFGGPAILSKHARLYNCTVSYCDRPRFFQETMWLLLCGCGVGFSVQDHHNARLPGISPKSTDAESVNVKVEDSIEGWSDAIGILVSSYFVDDQPFPEFFGKKIKYDLSEIRPAGSPISHTGGKAPGPEPLLQALNRITSVFESALEKGLTRLRPIDTYDIVMHSSDGVLAGGVRRSATICMFSHDDEEMSTAKTGNWFIDNPQRGRSNNSAVLIRDDVTEDQFSGLMKNVKEFGEPGFVFSDSKEALFNPCFHPDTRLATSDGLIRIEDLYKGKKPVEVIVDTRAGKGDEWSGDNLGTETRKATHVELTQKNAEVFRLDTSDGRSIKLTSNHEMPTNRGRLPLSELKEGDIVYTQSGEGSWGDKGSFNEGLLLGAVTGDGTFSTKEAFLDIWEDDFSVKEDLLSIYTEVLKEVSILNGQSYDDPKWKKQTIVGNKEKLRLGGIRFFRWFKENLGIENPKDIKDSVPECVWRGSREFVQGYLQGLLFSDGSVQLNGKGLKATLSVRLSQSNKKLLQGCQTLLSNFGISSSIYSRRPEGERSLPDGKGGEKDYLCRENFELIVNRPNAITLENNLGIFGDKESSLKLKLDERGRDCNKPERFQTTVTSITPEGTSDVYCLTEWSSNTVIANGYVQGQCVEIGMYAYDDEGNSGWSFCNLCEINVKKAKTKEDFYDMCHAAAVLGTMQAGYSSFPYLGEVTEKIVRREALLGCSMTGMMDNPEISFDPEIQREGAAIIRRVNERIAKEIGINPAARTTCIEPAGSTSAILGTASGIHPHHSKRYFRRVQVNKLEEPLQFFRQWNPSAVEESVWSANKSDDVITFLCEVPKSAKTKVDVSALELLDLVKSTQSNWIEAGKNHKLCTQPWLSHNVSNTINVKEDEWDEVEKFIYDNRRYYSGISLLPMNGDKDYPQAPFTTIYTPEEIVKEYGEGSLMASGVIVNGLRAFDDNLWAACDSALGSGEGLDIPTEFEGEATIEKYHKTLEKIAWVERVKKFAANYFKGDIRKTTYCLKDVHNWKTWCDLHREYQDVPWDEFFEKSDNTKVSQTIACAGGSCEVTF